MLVNKLGNFLLVIGAILLVVFFGSDLSQNPQYFLLLLGLGLVFWGFHWKYKGYRAPEPSPRFGILRRVKKSNPQYSEKDKD